MKAILKKISVISVTAVLALGMTGCVFGANTGGGGAEIEKEKEEEAPDYSTCVVGDFILKNGKIVSKDDDTPASGTVAAVIVRAASEDKPALGVGIVQSPEKLYWCTSSVFKETRVEGLAATALGDGYVDGSNGWEILKTTCTDAEEHPDYYPAWKYCLDYGTTQGLTGALATGWYLPTVAEFKTIGKNKVVINESFTKAGVENFEQVYWTCNENKSGYVSQALRAVLSGTDNCTTDPVYKYSNQLRVCAVRVFE